MNNNVLFNDKWGGEYMDIMFKAELKKAEEKQNYESQLQLLASKSEEIFIKLINEQIENRTEDKIHYLKRIYNEPEDIKRLNQLISWTKQGAGTEKLLAQFLYEQEIEKVINELVEAKFADENKDTARILRIVK